MKIKILFYNEIKINCTNKRLVDETNLFICYKTILLIIIITNDNVKFVKICDNLKIRLKKTIIIISIFVIFKSNYNLIFEQFFKRVVRMSNTNINDEFLKLIMYFDNKFIKVSFLVASINHLKNREINIVFVVEFLN